MASTTALLQAEQTREGHMLRLLRSCERSAHYVTGQAPAADGMRSAAAEVASDDEAAAVRWWDIRACAEESRQV